MQDKWIQIAVNIPVSDRFKMLLSFLDNWKICKEYAKSDLRMPSKNATDPNMPNRQAENPITPLEQTANSNVPYEKLPFLIHACA